MTKFKVGDKVVDNSSSVIDTATVMATSEDKIQVLWDDDLLSNWKKHAFWSEDHFELVAPPSPWRPMSDAPTNGRHVILSIKSGPFVYSIQGCYDMITKKWINAANIDSEPLCWMPNHLIPDEFKTWKD